MGSRLVYQAVVLVPQIVEAKAYKPAEVQEQVFDAFEAVVLEEKDGEKTVYPPKLLDLRDTGKNIPEPELWKPPSIA